MNAVAESRSKDRGMFSDLLAMFRNVGGRRIRPPWSFLELTSIELGTLEWNDALAELSEDSRPGVSASPAEVPATVE